MRISLRFKKILVHVFWSFFGAGVLVLLVAAVKSRQDERCKDIAVEFVGEQPSLFLNQQDVILTLTDRGKNPWKGDVLKVFDLRKMEEKLEKNPCVQDAEVYFDNQKVLQVKVRERIPVARVFTREGKSFFLDSSGYKLPLLHKSPLRLPVFTRYPYGTMPAATTEMPYVRDMIRMSQHLQQDEFLMALISQIDCIDKNQFELLPVVGDQVIEWGNGSSMEEKFRRLKLFYQSVIRTNGLDYYERIKLQFEGQIVGVRKEGAEDKKQAAAAALQIKEIIAKLQLEQQQKAEAATQSVIQNALQENRKAEEGATGNNNIDANRTQKGNVQEEQKKGN